MAAEEQDHTMDTQDQDASVDTTSEESVEAKEAEASDQSDSTEQQEETAAGDDKDALIEQLQKEMSDLKDQYLRKQADMDNFRKRLMREKEEAITYANKRLLEDLITIIDNFERAIQSAETTTDIDSFKNGIVMIEKEFVGMLERKWQLSRFDSVGEEFDPMKHEALMMEDSSDHESQVVLQDFQKGYMLGDQVLRAAKVKVANPVSAKDDQGGEE